jgi:hypothetical protein
MKLMQKIKFEMYNLKPLRPKKKKDLRYWQTNLKPLGDWDKDGKINLLDCRPFDYNRQGIAEIKEKVVETAGKLKEKIGELKEEKQKKKEEKVMEELEEAEKAEKFRFIVVKYFDDNWVNLGAFTTDRLDEELYQIQQNPDIEEIQITKDSDLATKLNRQMILQGAKEKVVKTAKEAGKYALKVVAKAAERATRDQDISPQAVANVKAGMQVRPQSYADMQRMAQGPSGRPPMKRVRPPTSRASIGSIGRNINLRGLREAGQMLEYKQAKDRYLDQPFVEEKPYGYSQRSPNYQEVSPFGESVVPYRPIARRQVSLPNRPAKAPAWGSTVIDLGSPRQPNREVLQTTGISSSRPIGMVPMGRIKFYKPLMVRFGVRKD